MFSVHVQAWIRLKISTSSDPSHGQMTHVACFGCLIDVKPSDRTHSPERDEGTPSFLFMSSDGNVLAKPEVQEQQAQHVIPVLSYNLPLALYYYTNPASVAFSLHITPTHRLRTTLIY
jgi:hypothetical protein